MTEVKSLCCETITIRITMIMLKTSTMLLLLGTTVTVRGMNTDNDANQPKSADETTHLVTSTKDALEGVRNR